MLQRKRKFRELKRQNQRRLFWQRSTRSLVLAALLFILRPAEADLARSQVKTLVFVLDSALRNVPMAVLHDRQHYLIEKYGIALTPGLQLLDPQPLLRGELKALTAGLTEARGDFPALRYVNDELAQVQLQVPSVELLDRQFTDRAFQNQVEARPFPVVHLATHGQFSSQAEETFILTWDDRIDVNQLKNWLRSSDPNRTGSIMLAGRNTYFHFVIISSVSSSARFTTSISLP